jgi:hypothetical protein
MTQSGKSTVLRKMFLSAAAPRTVIDPFESELTNIPGAVTFSDPRKATNAKGENWRQAATARFVPTDPEDLDAYDAVYDWCFRHFPRMVWTDECPEVLPVTGYPKKGRLLITNGAKRQIGHLGGAQRPRGIMRHLIVNAHHVLVWPMPNIDDLKHVADNTGVPVAVLVAALAECEPHGFVHIDMLTIPRTLTICSAIKP